MGDANFGPVRFAVMSPGGWGRRYLEAVRGSPRLKLEGVCSRQAETAAAAGAEFGGRAFRSYDELVRDPAVEAVLLPTPHFLHYAQAKAALLAGKHVFVEKPLANTVAEAEELSALSQARGLILAVGLQGRRTAGIRRARAMLDSGELGRVGLVTVTHGSPQVHQNYRSGDWETSDATMPGGILDQLGVHYADVLQYLLGPVVRVAGFVNRHVSAFPTIDCGAATYEFASGVVALHATHQVSAYISEVRLFTDRGLLQISRMGRELTWEPISELGAAKAGATTRQTIPLAGAEMNTTAIAEELDEFAGCIRTGAQPEVGAAEGLSALRLMRAVMEAHATGGIVSLAQPLRLARER